MSRGLDEVCRGEEQSVDVRGMVCVVFFGKKRRGTGHLMLACNSGRDTPTAGRSGQRMGLARRGLAVGRRGALQKATYLHGELERRGQRNAPLA
jgi:hypothetical protein